MTSESTAWWEKRALRAVDQLKLWQENPRLDPIENHITLADFTEELISTKSDKDSFFELISSISAKGFLSFDPIIVWKNDKNKYEVAEGNRRVLALRLLRHPHKAPRSIRKFIIQKAEHIDRTDIEKIRVCVAPNFEECEWYILQRHSSSTIQKRWERLQQQRWIVSLYDKYDNDLEGIKEKTGFTQGEIEKTLRYVKIRDLATRKEVLIHMNLDEKELIHSHRIPMSILERWFDSVEVREAWGLEYDGSDIVITKNEVSFLTAYAQLLKIIFNSDDTTSSTIKVNTRTVPEKNQEILNLLPQVVDSDEFESTVDTNNASLNEEDNDPASEDDNIDESDSTFKKKHLQGNPDRNQLVVGDMIISVSSFKLDALFREFQRLPVSRYQNVCAASLRVFLDLAVDEFIGQKDLTKSISAKHSSSYAQITLHQRLSFIVDTFIHDKSANKVIRALLLHSNQYSLNTLNNYVHGTDVHHVSRRTLNHFWDMLTPLLKILIDLRER